jgi:hypothetical protein
VQEVLFLDDGETVVTVGLVAIEGDPVEAAIEYRESVRIDGRVPLEDVDLDALTAPANAPGIVGDGQYVSPQYGVGIEWDTASWDIYDEVATSDPTYGEDMLHLAWLSEEPAWIHVIIVPPNDATLAEFVAYNADPDVYQPIYGRDAELLATSVEGSRGANVFRAWADDEPVLVLESYVFAKDGGSMVVTLYIAPASSVEESLPSAQQGIVIDGEPILPYQEVEDILTLFEGEATPAP